VVARTSQHGERSTNHRIVILGGGTGGTLTANRLRRMFSREEADITVVDGESAMIQPNAVEAHRSGRAGWLRAGVLGADDGLVSTASLMIGVAAAAASSSAIIVAGLAGLVAGAMSMAAGEYVSVSSQRDTELADMERETRELATAPSQELRELTELYVRRGLEPALARTVAERLTEVDALDAHMREELGIRREGSARPVQAAAVSAVSFAVGAALPVLAAVIGPSSIRIPAIAITAMVFLATLGMMGARIGGAPIARGALRVLVGGATAMVITAGIGHLAGVAGL
jgi:vacuolar iron transporter family protein